MIYEKDIKVCSNIKFKLILFHVDKIHSSICIFLRTACCQNSFEHMQTLHWPICHHTTTTTVITLTYPHSFFLMPFNVVLSLLNLSLSVYLKRPLKCHQRFPADIIDHLFLIFIWLNFSVTVLHYSPLFLCIPYPLWARHVLALYNFSFDFLKFTSVLSSTLSVTYHLGIHPSLSLHIPSVKRSPKYLYFILSSASGTFQVLNMYS